MYYVLMYKDLACFPRHSDFRRFVHFLPFICLYSISCRHLSFFSTHRMLYCRIRDKKRRHQGGAREINRRSLDIAKSCASVVFLFHALQRLETVNYECNR
ncbi:hypothetical protein HDV57DRAFT_238456 [Trichoderma longibrachiatum]|uniref:Uncharacterized protein n=1 Tax=Trichoderma longibrachiatum ATCC 18648 TaxID=983965 RepID=A0A2T4CEF4_TRILO|nr:hypothetical protein M440DRAFT_175426 [Trichoderma longibrachiatum ATCC 18648]